MTKQTLKETASGGTVGAGGIAVRLDGKGTPASERKRLKDYLDGFNSRVVNRWKYHAVKTTPFAIKVDEAFDLQDVLSRLRGIEGKNSKGAGSDNVTYGVEDDEGNIMKVTVRKDQADEFEATLGHELADIEAFSVNGKEGKDVSMAELLYNLKDKFDIIDVEFPKIPTDVVYNADQATYKAGADELPANDEVTDDQANLDGAAGELPPGGEGDLGGLDGAPGADAGLEGGEGEEDPFGPVKNSNDKMDLNDVEGLEDDEAPVPGEGGEDMGGLEDMNADGDGVEDFAEPEADEGSILDKVLDMLKAQAEASTAQANAEAERYRADQAEYSAKAANATIAQEEELARMEASMDKQKEQEKQSKKLADIAKYRVQQASGVTEAQLQEGDEGETAIAVRRMQSALGLKWRVEPTDDPETRNYKNTQRANEARELQARLRMAIAREQRKQQLAAQGKGKNTDPNAQQPQQQNGNQQQGQQAAGQQQGANGNANQ